MTDNQPALHKAIPRDEASFAAQVGAKAARKRRFLRYGDQGVWFGLGMSGLIGWSVAIPTLLGASLGVWLDQRYPEIFSWTLTLLFAGLVVGCLSAWRWVSRQNDAMRAETEDTLD
jgi:ATP synthase protein I